MQKLAVYAGLAAISSVLTFGASADASQQSRDGTVVSSSQGTLDVARKGADDKNPNERHGRGRDDGANHAESTPAFLQMARNGGSGDHDGGGHEGHGRGADDGAGHDARGRGADDGAGHIRRAHGADDAVGDDHGGQRG